MTLILVILVNIGMASCLQTEDLSASDSTSNATNNITDASWRITYFWDSDHEETYHFTGYTFQFEQDGSLTATNGSNTYSGTWREGNDDSAVKLYLFFSSPSSFEELSDDWHILEWTDNVIRLRDVSGGNGGTDLLTFEKI